MGIFCVTAHYQFYKQLHGNQSVENAGVAFVKEADERK